MDTINQNFLDIYEGTATNSSSLPIYGGGTGGVDETVLADYQKTGSYLTSNVAKLTANNTLYLGGLACTAYQTTAGMLSNVQNIISNESACTDIEFGGGIFNDDVYLTANLHVAGTLHIAGGQTIVNTTIITTEEKNFVFAYNTTTLAGANGAGIIVSQNDYANLIYNNDKNAWQPSVDVVPYQDGAQKLGSTSYKWNLYSNTINSVSIATTGNVGIGNTLYTGDKYGNTTAGSVGGALVNAIYIAIGNNVVNSAITSTSITVNSGATSVSINSSSVLVGNTTVNSSVNSSNFSVKSASSNVSINATMGVFVNSNIYLDSGTVRGYLDTTGTQGVEITNNSVGVGNSQNFAKINQMGIWINTYSESAVDSLGGLKANSSGMYVGNSVANTSHTQNQIFVGNSTSNTTITANSIMVNNILIGNDSVSTLVNSSIIDSFKYVTSTVANSTAVAIASYGGTVGGMYANSTFLGYGNTTVNTTVNSTAVIIGNTTVNNTINSTALWIGNFSSGGARITANNSNQSMTIGTTAGGNTVITGVSVNTGTYYVNVYGSAAGGLLANQSTLRLGTDVANTILSAGQVNSSAHVAGVYGDATASSVGGFRANVTTIAVGNNVTNTVITSSQINTAAHVSGVYGDATAASVGGFRANVTTISVGNNVTNTVINSSSVSTNAHISGTYKDATAAAIGGFTANSSVIGIGNSDVFSTLNSSVLTVNAIAIGNSTVNTTITAQKIITSIDNVRTVANSSAVATGINFADSSGGYGCTATSSIGGAIVNASVIAIGNSSVNTIINSTMISVNSAIVNSAVSGFGPGFNYGNTIVTGRYGTYVNSSIVSVGNATSNVSMSSDSVRIQNGFLSDNNSLIIGRSGDNLVAQFSNSDVSTTAISITNNPFAVGDRVRYTSYNAIAKFANLSNNTLYYVRTVSPDPIILNKAQITISTVASGGTIISPGTGGGAAVNNHAFVLSEQPVISSNNSSLQIYSACNYIDVATSKNITRPANTSYVVINNSSIDVRTTYTLNGGTFDDYFQRSLITSTNIRTPSVMVGFHTLAGGWLANTSSIQYADNTGPGGTVGSGVYAVVNTTAILGKSYLLYGDSDFVINTTGMQITQGIKSKTKLSFADSSWNDLAYIDSTGVNSVNVTSTNFLIGSSMFLNTSALNHTGYLQIAASVSGSTITGGWNTLLGGSRLSRNALSIGSGTSDYSYQNSVVISASAGGPTEASIVIGNYGASGTGGLKANNTGLYISDGTTSFSVTKSGITGGITIPIANNTTVGGVKAGGAGISIAGDGTISSTATAYTLPIANTTTLGGIRTGVAGITMANDGTGKLYGGGPVYFINAAGTFTIPVGVSYVYVTGATTGTVSLTLTGSFDGQTIYIMNRGSGYVYSATNNVALKGSASLQNIITNGVGFGAMLVWCTTDRSASASAVVAPLGQAWYQFTVQY
jgi:hypothetical protein